MRKLLLSFLLATTAATPAFAQRADREDRAEAREERRAKADAQKERGDRADRAAARGEREAARPERAERAERIERNVDSGNHNVTVREHQVRDRNVAGREHQVGDRNVTVREHQVRDQRRAANVNERGRPILHQHREVRQDVAATRQQTREELRQQHRTSRDRYVEHATQPRRVTPPANARPDRPAPPPAHGTHSSAPQWHTTWRHDSRYDWRHYRDRNRSHFRLGFYFDPFGWNYRRYNVGWRLWPSYYSNQYWLNDPWSYRLPHAPYPYRWVRYYDDAMLVDTMSGQVVDVMYDFFW